ncbi:hypothetical protein PS710_04829 [Pseudomonas fluorescens]|uniref:Uncharacterized protein n=1 Tax=Pseudomonas fluorescens TaxID=294 RepID=A0A5E7ENU7_PSEFL|nr:hypothetical protein PS710_04829 [Pseudomonas fluorescens]
MRYDTALLMCRALTNILNADGRNLRSKTFCNQSDEMEKYINE